MAERPTSLLSKRSSRGWGLRKESFSISQKKISSGVVHEVPADLKEALTSDPQPLTAWEDITPLARNGYVGLSQLKKQKPEAAGSSGAVQALGMENDAPVVGSDAPTADSKMVKLDIVTVDWGPLTSGLRVIQDE